MVVLLTQLKVFQSIGHFLPVASDTGSGPVLHCEATFTGRAHGRFNGPAHDVSAKQGNSHVLGCYAVGCKRPSRSLRNAVEVAAETRLDPAELVNAAIDALIRERCELPSLSTLLRLAGNAHRRINSTQWQQVHERMTARDVEAAGRPVDT